LAPFDAANDRLAGDLRRHRQVRIEKLPPLRHFFGGETIRLSRTFRNRGGDAAGMDNRNADAPVDSRDPRPFVNMAIGITRRVPGLQPQNPAQAVSIRDLIDAYTINGARFLQREEVAGSLEVGKSADFIVVDRDILKLADSGHAEDILRTQVLETWFQGKKVYTRPAH